MSLAVGFVVQSYHWDYKQLLSFGIFFVPLFLLFFDYSHALVSFYRVYFYPGEFSKAKKWFIAIPLICILLIAGSSTGIIPLELTLIWAILSFFHFLRQEFGVLMLTVHNGPPLETWEIQFHKWFYNTMIFGSVAMLIANPKVTVGWRQVDLYWINTANYPYLLNFFWCLMAAGLLFEAYLIVRYRSVNLSKWLRTGVFIFVFILLTEWTGRYMIEYILPMHAITYFYLSKNIMTKPRIKESFLTKLIFNGRWVYLKTHLFFIFIAFFTMNFFSYGYLFWRQFNINTHGLAMAIAAFLSFMHFITDGILWKKSYLLRGP